MPIHNLIPNKSEGPKIVSQRRLLSNCFLQLSARKCNNCLNIPSRMPPQFPRDSFLIHTSKRSSRRDTIEESGRVTASMEGANFSLRKAHIIKDVSSWVMQPSKDATSLTTVAFTKEKSRITKRMDRVLTSIPFKIMNIQGGGRRTSPMEEDDKNLETDRIMRASFKMDQRKAMAIMSANRVSMKGNFRRAILVERGHSATQMGELTKANGSRGF